MTRRLATIAFLAAAFAAALPSPASAAPLCADAVMNDWLDGRIDRRYPPRCYGDALAALPEDVRAYSTAVDDISRALRARVRELRSRSAGDERGSAVDTMWASLPIPLLFGAAIASILAAAALGQFVLRRLRHARLAHRPTRPIGQW